MPANPKRAIGIRLTDEARYLLERLAEGRGLTQTAVIESLVREEATRKRIPLPTADEIMRWRANQQPAMPPLNG